MTKKQWGNCWIAKRQLRTFSTELCSVEIFVLLLSVFETVTVKSAEYVIEMECKSWDWTDLV